MQIIQSNMPAVVMKIQALRFSAMCLLLKMKRVFHAARFNDLSNG